MKITAYNIHRINGRLSILLRWLKEASPDVVCLKELKTPQNKFPLKAIEEVGYNAIWHVQTSWNGVATLSKIAMLQEVKPVLPGDPDDTHSRYIEGIVNNMHICCLYLPNGNPYPGSKFDYKLKWFKGTTLMQKAFSI